MGLRIKQVVFISDFPRSREAKFAYGLKQAGWEVILLHKNVPTFDAANYFIEIHRYRNEREALNLANSYSPVVYHVFSCWNFNVAETLIRHKPGKIVFDDYDIMAGMVKEKFAQTYYPGQMKLERFCLENADGLCCRSLETQLAKRDKGYRYCGKRIFFPDYCRDDCNLPIQKKNLDQFTIANIGNSYIDPHSDIDHPNNFHLKLALILGRKNIGSILYKTLLTDAIVKFFDEAGGGTSFVSIKNLNYKALLEEVSNLCHAGLICVPQGITSNPDGAYLQSKRDYAIGNKAFDYIDAGIPIIMDAESRFLYWFIKRYHKIFEFSQFISDLDNQVQEIKHYVSNYGEDLYNSMKALSIHKHIPRLVKFYESI